MEPRNEREGNPMERVVVELSPFTRRSRSVAVSHLAAGLPRGLEPGEFVVVHDPADDADFTATVADVGFELEDTIYRLELGTRITPEEAAEWLAPTPSADETGHVSTRRLLDLLLELRSGERALQEFLGVSGG
jgi:hypothetical protein